MAGASGKPLSQKLGLKPGFCIFVDSAPADYRKLVGEWPEGAKLVKGARAPLDVVHLFAIEARGLAARLRRYRGAIAPDGMVWVSWPKKTSGIATDLSDIVVRDIALPLGLVDIKVCAVDDVRSGLKFVIPKVQRNKRSGWRKTDPVRSSGTFGAVSACPSDGARSSSLLAVLGSNRAEPSSRFPSYPREETTRRISDVPHERPHINRAPIVVIAIVVAVACISELGMEIHERWKAPDVQSSDQLEHSTTGEATQRAGAQLIPSNPKLASEPKTAGPKPKQPGSDD